MSPGGRLTTQEVPLGSTVLQSPASLMTHMLTTHPSGFFLLFALPTALCIPLESLARARCTVNHRESSAKPLLLPSGQGLFPGFFFFPSTHLQSKDTGSFHCGLHRYHSLLTPGPSKLSSAGSPQDSGGGIL